MPIIIQTSNSDLSQWNCSCLPFFPNTSNWDSRLSIGHTTSLSCTPPNIDISALGVSCRKCVFPLHQVWPLTGMSLLSAPAATAPFFQPSPFYFSWYSMQPLCLQWTTSSLSLDSTTALCTPGHLWSCFLLSLNALTVCLLTYTLNLVWWLEMSVSLTSASSPASTVHKKNSTVGI